MDNIESAQDYWKLKKTYIRLTEEENATLNKKRKYFDDVIDTFQLIIEK